MRFTVVSSLLSAGSHLMQRIRQAAESRPLDVLSLSHNHGEACEMSIDFRNSLVNRVRSEIETASLPDVVAMSSQEVRADDWYPLVEAIRGLPYVLVGVSDISGTTKLFCSKVETAIEVAVRSDVVGQVRSVTAEKMCTLQSACKLGKSKATRQRFYWFKGTKGHVAVHVQVGDTRLRLVSAHMDTNQFEDNILKYTGPTLGRWQREAPGVSIIGADFNNRVGASISTTLCAGQLTSKKMATLFNVSSDTFQQDLRLSNVQSLLQSGARAAGASGVSAAIIPPAALNGIALPTYKYPALVHALAPAEVMRQADALFGTEGTNVCKKDPPSIGVLDSVASVHDPSEFTIRQQGSPIWAMMPGSDHALVGALLHVAPA